MSDLPLPRTSLAPLPALPRLAALLDGLRYDAAASGKRDQRLDFLRGLAIFSMVTNHLAGRSYFGEVFQSRFYAAGGDGFAVLSGLVLGTLSVARLQGGVWNAGQRLLDRCWTLYRAGLVLALVFGALSFVAPRWARPIFDGPPSALWALPLAAASFHLAPPILDILQFYVLCLLLAPGMLWLLARGLTRPLLIGSVALWALHQLHPYALSIQPLNRNHVYFAFPAWQLLFVVAFTAGFHREALRKLWARCPPLLMFLGLGAAVTVGMVAAHRDLVLGTWPASVPFGATWDRLTDRSSLGAVRILVLATLFPFLFLIVDRLWKPLASTLGRVLTPLGQSSLYVYLLHVPLAAVWMNLPAGWVQHRGVATLLQGLVFLLLWGCVRRRVLFNVIPR